MFSCFAEELTKSDTLLHSVPTSTVVHCTHLLPQARKTGVYLHGHSVDFLSHPRSEYSQTWKVELLNKEQTGFKELFTDYQPLYNKSTVK